MTLFCSYARRTFLPYGLFLIGSFFGQHAFGTYASVDVFNGPEDDFTAIGRFLTCPDGDHLGAWTLPSTVEDTDFSNKWGSSQPTPGSDLNREWVSFDASFASAVPEPEGTLAVVSAAPLLMLGRRRW